MNQLPRGVIGELRSLLVLVTGIVAATLFTGCFTPHAQYPAPPVSILQSGDLILPKSPGAWVPRAQQLGQTTADEAVEWEQQKEQYMAQLRAKPNLTPADQDQLRRFQQMTYADFAAEYYGPGPSNRAELRGLGGLVSVGHVGIIRVHNGMCTVVEAVTNPGNKVREIAYSDWLQSHKGNEFWVKRLIGEGATKRAEVAEIAVAYLDRPYWFFGFNLKDDSSFYCSKLAWLSIFKAVGYAPDNNSNGKRRSWYSPLDLTRSPHLERVFNERDYGTGTPQ